MKKSQIIIVNSASALAEYYYEFGKNTYESVTKEAIESDERIIFKSIVGNTNMTFACEIIMKVIAINEGKKLEELENTHNLNDLFQMLLNGTRNAISIMTVDIYNSKTNTAQYTEEDFYSDLEINKNAFVECRYWYELPKPGMQGKRAGQLFIYSFATALMDFIK